MYHKYWSETETKRVLRMKKKGMSSKEIGAFFGRSAGSVSGLIWRVKNNVNPDKVETEERLPIVKEEVEETQTLFSTNDPIKKLEEAHQKYDEAVEEFIKWAVSEKVDKTETQNKELITENEKLKTENTRLSAVVSAARNSNIFTNLRNHFGAR